MKSNLLFLVLSFSLVGCESLKRITEGTETKAPAAQAVVNIDDYVITGVTIKDYQSVYFDVKGMTITVEVKKPGDIAFTTLDATGWPTYNEYHVFTVPTQGVRFDHLRERFIGGGYAQTSDPAAPIGTEFKIHVKKTL